MNIVRPSTVSLNCFSLNIEDTNSNFEFFNNILDSFNNVGLIMKLI